MFEQPGVNALNFWFNSIEIDLFEFKLKAAYPGTPSKIPFLPANKSLTFTALPGLSSCNVKSGSWEPSFEIENLTWLIPFYLLWFNKLNI